MKYILLSSAMMVLLSATGSAAQELERFRSEFPEYGLAEGPDAYYLTRHDGPWGGGHAAKLLAFPFAGGAPTTPSWANADANESDFYYSTAAQMGCFTSDRGRDNADIWCVRWQAGSWGAPFRLPEPVSSDGAEYSPVIRPDGEIYFASDRAGGMGAGDIYRARRVSGEWRVEALGPEINSKHGEWNLEISPDGRVLIFEASGRVTNRSIPGDLYLSRRAGDNWSSAVPLSTVNGIGSDLMPRFMGDGSIVLASSEGEDADLRRVALEDIAPVRPLVAAVSRSVGEVVLLDPDSLETIGRIPVGAGPHDVAASEDGRIAVTPLLGVFPKPHAEPIKPSALEWERRASDGFVTLDLGAGKRLASHTMEGCARPHGAATTAQGDVFWITCENEAELREVDARTGETRRVFELEEGVHKVMLLANSRKLVTSNTDSGTVSLIDLATGKVKSVASGRGAEALAANADQARIYVANSRDRNVCEIDVKTASLGRCLPASGSFPIALAVDETTGWVWVANNQSSNLVALDFKSGRQVKDIALPSQPLGMAFDQRNRRIYVGLPRRNEILLIDAARGETITSTQDAMEVDDIDLLPAAHFRTSPDT